MLRSDEPLGSSVDDGIDLTYRKTQSNGVEIIGSIMYKQILIRFNGTTDNGIWSK